MSSDLADSSKATEILKEILKINLDSSSFQSASVSEMASSSIVRSPSSFVAATDLPSKQTYVNGKTQSEPSIMNTENDGNEIDAQQQITLTGSEESVSYCVDGAQINFICRTSNHTSGSSKVRISNIVNSVWESRYYYGQLVAAHISRNYIAYAIKIPTSEDGAVRVINRRTNVRLLLKGMRGAVADLAFAHIVTEIVLGAVDEYGNIFVYSIKDEEFNLSESLILEIRRSESMSCKSRFRRLLWCPYLPEEPGTDEELDVSDSAKTMVVTYAMEAEIWNVDTVSREYGCGPLSTEGITEGYQHFKEHIQPVTDAALPPDGSAMATCSDDGSVKFFQVGSIDGSETQSCLHNWIPHEGKPLSCLFFLDNKKNPLSDEQYWKFAITGCDQNRELKVWNCASWKCLQTIRFESEDENLKPELKARMDESAEFLILSNITYRVLYILHVYQDKDRNFAKVISIAEFAVTHPILSFDVLDVCRKRFKQNSDDEHMEEFACNESLGVDEYGEEGVKCDKVVDGIVVKLVYVHPKSLQECVIAFQPASSFDRAVGSLSSASQDSLYFKDKLSDVSFDTSCVDVSGNFSGKQQRNSFGGDSFNKEKNLSSVLLTPDVFTMPNEPSSPVKAVGPERSLVNLDDLPSPSSLQQLSPTVGHNKPSDNTHSKSGSPKDVEDVGKKRDSLKSTGSSPSLEVQEILNKSLVDAIVEDKNDDLQLTANIHNDDSHIMDSIHQTDQLTNLMSLVSGVERGKKSENAFGPLSTVPCIPDDFTKKTCSGLGWPPTTTIPQHAVLSEERLDSSQPQQSSKGSLATEKVLLERVSSNLITLTQSMQNVMRLLDIQQNQLTSLKEDIQSGQSSSKQMTVLNNFQKDLTNSLKALLEKHHHAETSIIGGLVKSHEERTMTALAQIANNSNVNRLESSVKMEFQSNVVPLLTREMKHMESVIHTELTHRLATTDSLLKENLHRLVESKTFLSGVSGAVAAAIHGTIRSTFQELMQNSVIPVFERMCHNMFVQINEAFKSGTKEYVQHLDASIDKEYRNSQEFVTGQLQSVVSKVQLSTEQLTSSANIEINNQLQSTLKKFEEQMSARITSLLQEQMSLAMKEHQTVIGNTVVNAIRSRTVTPVPTDFQISQTQILQLVTQGQINAAFKQALSVNDLGLVTFLCEKVSPSQIFNQSPCPLQPPVLLALISQLSTDLESSTELKHEYLKEAVVNLDFSDPIISSHSPRVLDTLKQKLLHYTQTHPNNKITTDIRLLLMATTPFLKPPIP